MEKAYVIQNPIYDYAFDLIREIETHYDLRPILWYTDPDLYFYHLHRLPYRNRWLDRVYFAKETAIDRLLVEVGQRFDICAVFPWQEDAVESAAWITERLGLVGPDPKIIKLFRDKFRFKAYLKERNPALPLHRFFFISSFEELIAKRAEWPDSFVLKPVDGVANRGNGFFSTATSRQELSRFFADNQFSRFILEEFLVGTEYAVNGQVDAVGKVAIYSIFHYERIAANGRPTLYFRDWMQAQDTPEFGLLARYAEQVMQASGLKSSPFHMELMLCGQQPYLIEVGARFPGANMVYATQVAHGPGFHWFREAAHYYLGQQGKPHTVCDWEHYNRYHYLVLTGLSVKKETVINLQGFDEVKALPECVMWFKEPKVGDQLRVTVDGESSPYAVHLMSLESDALLKDLSDRVLQQLVWNQNLNLFIRLKFVIQDRWLRLKNKAFISLKKLEFRIRRKFRFY